MSNFIKIWQAGSAVCLFAAVVLLCGCRSDRYYQACAADKAREFLLENAPELTPAQIAFVKYNDPILLTGDGLGTGATGIKQICISWSIPGAEKLYMVFGVSRERMDDWYPNRLIKRNYVKPSAEINSAVAACRKFAVTNFYDTLSKEDLNIIRLSNPEIALTAFELRPKESINNPNDLTLNKFDEENVKEKARAKALAELKKEQGEEEKEPVQISLTWKISLHRYAVFCGTAADESLKGWQLNFAGLLSDYETNVARKKFLKMSDDFNTPIPVPEEEKNTAQEAK